MNDGLIEIGKRLRTQDNRCTADPMFCVQEKRTIYGMDPRWSDNPIWIDTSDEVHQVPEPEDGEETETIEQTGKFEYWETVMVAFTEAGCEEYLRLNGHNHRGEMRIYAESFRRCPEMLAIRAFMLGTSQGSESESSASTELFRVASRGDAADGPRFREGIIQSRKLLKMLGYDPESSPSAESSGGAPKTI